MGVVGGGLVCGGSGSFAVRRVVADGPAVRPLWLSGLGSESGRPRSGGAGEGAPGGSMGKERRDVGGSGHWFRGLAPASQTN